MDKKYEIYDVQAEMFIANQKYFPNMLCFNLRFECNLGFGELSFGYDTEKKTWDYDTECMSKEFCLVVLNKWLEDLGVKSIEETK